jgi:hypothetical protein
MKKEKRLSKFDVATDKNDYELLSEMSDKTDPAEKTLVGFIKVYHHLSCPSAEILNKVGIWLIYEKDYKKTAMEFNVTPSAIYQMIYRLKELIRKWLNSLNPKSKESKGDEEADPIEL